jgi:quercetin dioxygenase-like cupin family protein
VQKYNIHTAKEKNVSINYFTGKINIREIFSEENSSELEMYHVTFYSGALTSLHYHESDQILIATKGQGVVGLVHGRSVLKPEVDINSITLLHEGDTVCVPANIIHFHGALNMENFSHIAIMKMYKSNQGKSIPERSVTKWEHDLLIHAAPNERETAEKFMMATQEEIRERVQTAISKKLTGHDM